MRRFLRLRRPFLRRENPARHQRLAIFDDGAERRRALPFVICIDGGIDQIRAGVRKIRDGLIFHKPLGVIVGANLIARDLRGLLQQEFLASVRISDKRRGVLRVLLIIFPE